MSINLYRNDTYVTLKKYFIIIRFKLSISVRGACGVCGRLCGLLKYIPWFGKQLTIQMIHSNIK